jgi:hypothetical protein
VAINPEWLYSQKEGSVELWLGPRGGNGDNAGMHGQGSVSDPSREETHHTASYQNLESSRSMDANTRVEAVIHLFGPLHWIAPTDEDVERIKHANKSPRNGKVIYLGIWYFHKAYTERREDLIWEGNPYTYWAGEMNTIYYIRPLYNATHKPPADLHNPLHRSIGFDVLDKLTTIYKWIPKTKETKDADIKKIRASEVITDWIQREISERKKEPLNLSLSDPVKDLENSATISLSQYITQAARIAIASFARLRERNVILTEQGQKQLTHLYGELLENLGWVLCTNSVPNPIRTYNLQTIAWILSMIPEFIDFEGNKYHKRLEEIDILEHNHLADIIFRSIILRLSPTVGWYVAFAHFLENNREGDRLKFTPTAESKRKIYIPGLDDVDLYKQFLKATLNQGLQSSMNIHTKALYRASLLGVCKRTVEDFLLFLNNLKDVLPGRVDAMQSAGNRKREDWIKLVSQCFEELDSYHEGDGNTQFLASLVIADVEEVAHAPFDKPSEVILGSGGKRGLTMIAGNDDNVKAKAILHYLDKIAPSSILAALGLYRDNEKAYVSFNRRRLLISDIDNISCKMSVCQGKTTGSRLIILHPALNQYYDFPILPQWVEGFNLLFLSTIAEEAIGCLQNSETALHIKIHQLFQYYQEEKHWPTMCSQMRVWLEKGHPDTRKGKVVDDEEVRELTTLFGKQRVSRATLFSVNKNQKLKSRGTPPPWLSHVKVIIHQTRS